MQNDKVSDDVKHLLKNDRSKLTAQVKEINNKSAPFPVLDFYLHNKDLFKKYLKKNTIDFVVPDYNVEAIPQSWWYMGREGLLRTGIKDRTYTLVQKLEWLKCALRPKYFIKKHVKIIDIDEGIVNFELRKYQEKIVDLVDSERFAIFNMARQTGKMIDLETPIMTPNGFVKNGDLKVGDFIYGRNGLPTRVTYISEQRNDMNQYELTFDNGEVIKACGEHLWAYKSSSNTNERVLNTEEMIKDFDRDDVWIDVTKPLQFDTQSITIDPYTIGRMLCDGNIDRLPDEYIYNNEEVRLGVIQGMMDSQGEVNRYYLDETLSFPYEDDYLGETISLLLNSLGVKTVKVDYNYNQTVNKTIEFCVDIDELQVFRIDPERQEYCTSDIIDKRIYLKSYRKLEDHEKVYMQCLTVEDDDHMFLCGRTLLPTHNTTTLGAYIAHQIIFFSNYVGIIAQLTGQAQEIVERIQRAYENLPVFLQPGVTKYNKRSFSLGNTSSVISGSSTSSAIRGKSFSLVFIDEVAWIKRDMEFYESVYPTISSGKKSRIYMTSTPNGMRGLFYKIWSESEKGINSFKRLKVTWRDVPGRDEAWKRETINNSSLEQFEQEHEVEFQGSHGSLLKRSVLESLIRSKPKLETTDGIKVFHSPNENDLYLMTVDVSRGLGQDYHSFTIINLSTNPHEVVCTFKNNTMDTFYYPYFIHQYAKKYNDAFVLVELNDAGGEVANTLYHELEYENLLTINIKKGQKIGFGSTRHLRLGVKTTNATKTIGCNNAKVFIENGKINLNDQGIIEEFGTFVPVRGSYAADEGCNDDQVMTIVLYSWAMTQEYFMDLTNQNAKEEIVRKIQKEREELKPYGPIINNSVFGDDDVSFEHYM